MTGQVIESGDVTDDATESGGDDDAAAQPPDSSDAPISSLQIEIESGPEVPDSLDLDWLRARTEDAAREAELSRGSVAVRVLGQAEMAAVHEQFLGFDSPTDVLTFDLTDGTAAPGFIDAEIAVCYDIANEEVGAGRSVEAELLLYIVHGILHCLGFDDQQSDDFNRMHRREDAILEAIGVGRQFDRNNDG